MYSSSVPRQAPNKDAGDAFDSSGCWLCHQRSTCATSALHHSASHNKGCSTDCSPQTLQHGLPGCGLYKHSCLHQGP